MDKNIFLSNIHFPKVKHMLDQYELRGMEVLVYEEFVVSIIPRKVKYIDTILQKEIMQQLESVGWVKVQKKLVFICLN